MTDQRRLRERVEARADEIESNSVFSPEQARVVACKDHGLSHQETADVLGKPIGTVRPTWLDCRDKWERAGWTRDELGEAFD